MFKKLLHTIIIAQFKRFFNLFIILVNSFQNYSNKSVHIIVCAHNHEKFNKMTF